MNNLLIKNQILFLILTIFLAVFCVTGIKVARAITEKTDLSVETKTITKPFEQYYNYRLALTERDNQTILQTIINPKNNLLPVSNNKTDSIPVLVYHGIIEEADGKNTTTAEIKAHLYALYHAGYKTISLDDYLLFIEGKKELPEKSFLLTFDDGRKDSLKIDPVLKVLNYQAVMFVITDQLIKESTYYLSLDQLKDMQKSGRWNIQSHGKFAHTQYAIDQNGRKGNFYSNKLWLTNQNRLETTEEYRSRITKDLTDAKTDLEKAGFTPKTIAFPFGDLGQFSTNFPEAQTILQEETEKIYQASFYQLYKSGYDDFSTQNYYNSQQFLAKRITADPKLSGEELVALLESGTKKQLSYNDNLSNPYNWTSSWGTAIVENNQLMVTSTFETTGGSAFLNGSNHWTDYKVDANVQWLMGNTFSIHTRVANSSNFLSCDFSDTQVDIKTKLNGELKTLVTKKVTETFNPAFTKFSVTVSGNEVTCAINDKDVVSTTQKANFKYQLQNGGIGFSTWGPETGNSAVLISSLQVTDLQK